MRNNRQYFIQVNKGEKEPALMMFLNNRNAPADEQFGNQKNNEPGFCSNDPRVQMLTVKFQNAAHMDAVEEPAADIAHEEKVHAQAEEVKDDDKHHKNIIGQKQLER